MDDDDDDEQPDGDGFSDDIQHTTPTGSTNRNFLISTHREGEKERETRERPEKGRNETGTAHTTESVQSMYQGRFYRRGRPN